MSKRQRIIKNQIDKIYDGKDLKKFWKNNPELTIIELLDIFGDSDNIVNILHEETKKASGDIDLVVRSWTTSNEVNDAFYAIDNNIDRINRRKGRKIMSFLQPHRCELSIEKLVPAVLSRDHGKTCVKISTEDVLWAKEQLRRLGKVVSPKTVEDFLYENKEHEPYLSRVDRMRLGLI